MSTTEISDRCGHDAGKCIFHGPFRKMVDAKLIVI
jgi:hypothetical protein